MRCDLIAVWVYLNISEEWSLSLYLSVKSKNMEKTIKISGFFVVGTLSDVMLLPQVVLKGHVRRKPRVTFRNMAFKVLFQVCSSLSITSLFFCFHVPCIGLGYSLYQRLVFVFLLWYLSLSHSFRIWNLEKVRKWSFSLEVALLSRYLKKGEGRHAIERKIGIVERAWEIYHLKLFINRRMM